MYSTVYYSALMVSNADVLSIVQHLWSVILMSNAKDAYFTCFNALEKYHCFKEIILSSAEHYLKNKSTFVIYLKKQNKQNNLSTFVIYLRQSI